MRAIVRDYSRPGDIVCDPCSGAATTLLAALTEGRRAVGAEAKPAHFEAACARLKKGWTTPLFLDTPTPKQEKLL
jgi:site-specific DNA-methyltransferase (adenine-specific)